MSSFRPATNDESLLLKGRISTIPILIDLFHLIFVACLVVISVALPILLVITLTWFLIAFIGFVRTAISILTTDIWITNKRLMARTGLLSKRQLELLLSKLESVEVSQPFIGRMFNYGTIGVRGTGSSTVPFRFIKSPNRVRHACATAAEQQHQRSGLASNAILSLPEPPTTSAALPVFEVVVVDRNSGAERSVDVRASNVDRARDLVASTGEIVGGVRLKSIG